MAVTRVEKLGPWGGNGGEARDTGHTTRLARIKINHQNFICTMQFQYELNGVLQWSPQWGRDAIGKTVEIVLEEGEFLCSVSGHSGPYAGYHIVTSLTLISNKQKYGPFGKETGTAFGLPQAGNNKIVGFHGRAGGLLDAIGVYMETYPSNTVKDYATEREELSKKVVEVTEENSALKEAAKNHIKEREELSKKVVEVTAENNALKEASKNHIEEREELSKKVVEVTAENNALKEAAKNHIKDSSASGMRLPSICLVKNLRRKVVAMGRINREAVLSDENYSIVLDNVYEPQENLYDRDEKFGDVRIGELITWPKGFVQVIGV